MYTQKKSPQNQALGRAVREYRVRMGLNQAELGKRSGFHRNYVGAIERGEVNPTIDTVCMIANGLGIRVSKLLLLSEEAIPLIA